MLAGQLIYPNKYQFPLIEKQTYRLVAINYWTHMWSLMCTQVVIWPVQMIWPWVA